MSVSDRRARRHNGKGDLRMIKRIALFNHKGGVSKTTTTFNLGWRLAQAGRRVILVDADPQCNLTELVLGYKGPSELETFYASEAKRNLKSGLSSAFESKPIPIKAVDCVPIKDQDGLFLLPGHIALSEYEVTLGIAQELSGSIQTLQNLPGSISELLTKTASTIGADYMLIDMNPSLSAFNQNLLMTSDYFIVPTTPDYYSVMAIDSLTRVIPSWYSWSQRAKEHPVLQQATYPFPHITPKFLGTIIQNYRPRRGRPTAGFQQWIDEINDKVTNLLVPALNRIGMMLSEEQYISAGLHQYCLETIPDFSSLIARSQEAQTPIFDLTDEQLQQSGTVLAQTKKSQKRFRKVFSKIAKEVVTLTQDAGSN